MLDDGGALLVDGASGVAVLDDGGALVVDGASGVAVLDAGGPLDRMDCVSFQPNALLWLLWRAFPLASKSPKQNKTSRLSQSQNKPNAIELQNAMS